MCLVFNNFSIIHSENKKELKGEAIGKFISDVKSFAESKEIAKILAEGHPVARFSLKSHEFGPRALGNRSILADPRNQESINIINK